MTKPRIMPVVILALAALAGVKATSLIVGFSSASAEPKPAPEARPPEPVQSEPEIRIVEMLAERRAELDAREAAVETREKLLEATERRIEEKIVALQAEREGLKSVAAEHERREAEEFAALSNAYERMKPKDAARIFDILEADILVPVASGMRTTSLSGVLAEMNPERARELTRLLAARKADAAATGAQ